jgi:hypothetical protein
MSENVIAFPKLVSRDETAALLRVRPQTLAVWATTGRYNLPFVKVGRRVMYRLVDIERFISANLVMQEAA